MGSGHSIGVGPETELAWSHGSGEDVHIFLQSFDWDEIHQVLHSTTAEEGRASLTFQDPPPKPHSNVREHLLWFFEHPWFSRTWVYQEFVLPIQTLFLIGDFSLPGHELENFFNLGWPRSAAWIDRFHHKLNVNKNRANLLTRAPSMEFLRATFQSRHQLAESLNPNNNMPPVVSASQRYQDTFTGYDSLTFADMLEAMAASQSQDDRDHVYAFIGFAPFLLHHMRVDYTLSVEQTFAAMMKSLVKEGRNLDFFGSLPSDVDISKSKLNLPSWVPNWTVKTTRVPILSHDNLFYAAGEEYGLSTTEKCKHHGIQSASRNELVVAGKIIDIVSHKLRPYSVYQVTKSQDVEFHRCTGLSPWDTLTLDRFIEEMIDFGFSTQENISKALLRTLLMDGVQWAALAALTSDKPMYRTGREIFGLPHYKKMEEVLFAILQSPDVDFDNLPCGATLQVLHELSKVQYRRRVVYYANGRFALAPDWAEKGSKIALLHGSRTPIVLRPRQDEKFGVVGQCYYDGAMYGEMADQDDNAATLFKLV